jgi:hypothetical protein
MWTVFPLERDFSSVLPLSDRTTPADSEEEEEEEED